jgi:hypothetical protein
MRIQLLLPIVALAALLFQSESIASVQFAAQGALDFNSSAYGFASSPSVLLGAQLTMDISYPFQVGLAYEHNGLSYNDGSGNGTLKFYGLVGRIRTVSPFFFDGQIGLDVRDSYGNSVSWGVGSGYIFPLAASVDIAPRVGYRYVPDGGYARSLIDVGAMLTFKFN